MPAVTSVMASSWLCVRQRANAVRIARKKSLMVFVIKAPKNSDLGLGSIGSRGSKGLVRRKHNEAPQILIALRAVVIKSVGERSLWHTTVSIIA